MFHIEDPCGHSLGVAIARERPVHRHRLDVHVGSVICNGRGRVGSRSRFAPVTIAADGCLGHSVNAADTISCESPNDLELASQHVRLRLGRVLEQIACNVQRMPGPVRLPALVVEGQQPVVELAAGAELLHCAAFSAWRVHRRLHHTRTMSSPGRHKAGVRRCGGRVCAARCDRRRIDRCRPHRYGRCSHSERCSRSWSWSGASCPRRARPGHRTPGRPGSRAPHRVVRCSMLRARHGHCRACR